MKRSLRKPRTPAQLIPSEHQSQVAFFERVDTDPRTKNLRIFAVPNGGKRHVVVAMKLKREGVRPGVPDIFVDVPMPQRWNEDSTIVRKPRHGLRIEMKKKGNWPTVEQHEWLKSYANAGYETAVCYSAQEAWDTLMQYLGYDQ